MNPQDFPLDIDSHWLTSVLNRLLATPSPTGLTDDIVNQVCQILESLDVPYELTRRGAIRATLKGRISSPDRAIVAHLDTLGAMVRSLGERGRPQVVSIGTWPARSAEGARVTLFTDSGQTFRGSLLPKKASGHVFGKEVDQQPASWDNLELRLDEPVHNTADLEALGIRVGDILAVDPGTECLDNGFIVSRFLDDKAGVAAVLAAIKAVCESGQPLPIDCHPLFTLSEETGAGASHILHGDVAELVAVDNGTLAPGQHTSEYGATIAMQDSTGPFDWHLTRHLLNLCDAHAISHQRDVFRFYRSDAASALEAGNDIRTALVCFAVDASHGYERTHLRSLTEVSRLLARYMLSPPAMAHDASTLTSARRFLEDSDMPVQTAGASTNR